MIRCLPYDWQNHNMWSHRNCRTHSTETLELVNTQPPPPPLPCSMEYETILFHFFYAINTSICYVGCLMITNTWTNISLYITNTPILEKKISVCIFSHQLVNTCDFYLFRLLKCEICSTIPVKMPLIGQLSLMIKVY